MIKHCKLDVRKCNKEILSKIQKTCFAHGIHWPAAKEIWFPCFTRIDFLYLSNIITFSMQDYSDGSWEDTHFSDHYLPEITPGEFLAKYSNIEININDGTPPEYFFFSKCDESDYTVHDIEIPSWSHDFSHKLGGMCNKEAK